MPAFATGAAVVTWTKLGDEYPAAARCLTDAEFRTHTEALCWSSWRLLDLRVPKADVRRFAESPDAEIAVDGLVDKGWWADDGDAWDIGLHFPEWQQDRAQVEHRRAYLAEAQKRSRLHRAGDHSQCLPEKCPQAPRPSTVDPGPIVSTVDPGRVGSGYRPPDPEEQDQRQVQEPSVRNSQNRGVPDGSGMVADDAHHFPIHDAESTTAGSTRASTTHAPIERIAS